MECTGCTLRKSSWPGWIAQPSLLAEQNSCGPNRTRYQSAAFSLSATSPRGCTSLYPNMLPTVPIPSRASRTVSLVSATYQRARANHVPPLRMQFDAIHHEKIGVAWPRCAANSGSPGNRIQNLERYKECGLEGLTDRAANALSLRHGKGAAKWQAEPKLREFSRLDTTPMQRVCLRIVLAPDVRLQQRFKL
jgi:hypothetical protein